MTVEERQEKGSNVRPVDVGIRHYNDPMIAELFNVEIVTSNSATKCRNHRANFFVL